MTARVVPGRTGFRRVGWGRMAGFVLAILLVVGPGLTAQPLPPELTQPVNDFADVIDAGHATRMDRLIRALERATGDVVVVATIRTFAPYADIREYAVKMFENHGRGIGQRGRDNGVLVLLAVDDRRVWIEVGYDLEQFITDGFAGETARAYMAPEFSRGNFGAGLYAGLTRLAGRIADRRNVRLVDLPDDERSREGPSVTTGNLLLFIILAILIASAVMSRFGPHRRARRRSWGTTPWSGWSSGVGSFGGRSGGFGGGFGGFGGGRSGGGGGGAGW